MIDQVLAATQSALKKQMYSDLIDDEKEFFRTLKENGLAGLVLPYIDEKKVSATFNKFSTQVLYEYVTRDEAQQALITKLNDLLNKHDINHIFLKGTKLKTLYEKTFMRGMGDIDILVNPEDIRKIEKIFGDNHILIMSRSPQHDVYQTEKGLLIEIHPSIYYQFNLKYKLFEKPWDYAKHVANHTYEFTPEFELLFIAYHLAKHFESSGVGLRSILDVGIYVQAYQDSIDEKLLVQYLDQMEMKTFFYHMLYLNKKYFDIDSTFLPPSMHIEENVLSDITQYIAASGVHGKGEKFNEMAPRLVNTKNKKKSKWNVIISSAFPKYKDMKVMYPVIQKCFLLLPIFYVVRVYDLTIKRGRSSRMKIKKLNVGQQEKQHIIQIFETLGLK